jgi:hypothetical protein
MLVGQASEGVHMRAVIEGRRREESDRRIGKRILCSNNGGCEGAFYGETIRPCVLVYRRAK